MGLKPGIKAGTFKGCPAGNYIAICDIVADFGLQPGSGKFPEPREQIYLRFEIPAKRIDYEKDGKQLSGPQVIGNAYTASMGKKANLRKLIQNWYSMVFTDQQAKDFYLGDLLGKACMLNVVITKGSNEVEYSNIGSISALPEGVPIPKAELPLLMYDPERTDAHDVLDKLPQWMREKILNPAKYETSNSTGVYEDGYAEQDVRMSPAQDDLPPVDSYDDQTLITDSDIPF